MERPEDAEAGAEGRHGQAADVIASELEGAVVADSGLGVGREGSEAIDLFEDGEVSVGRLERLKAAEGLVMLVETSDHEFDGVVGGGDGVIANAVDQFGPVAFEEVKACPEPVVIDRVIMYQQCSANVGSPALRVKMQKRPRIW